MFAASAEYYDLIYANLKDYKAESAQIAALLCRLNPDGRAVLDVACGTGEHALHLAAHGYVVDGLDLDGDLIRLARRKNPTARFFEADMAELHLPHRYDAILCLFSSIAYLETLDSVIRALKCFREHLAPGGVAVVEPWFPPGVLDPDRVSQDGGEANGVRVCRTSRLEIEERISRIYFDYEITDAAGPRQASEVHTLGLFTQDEMGTAFREAQLEVEYDPQGLTGRGLYIGRIAG